MYKHCWSAIVQCYNASIDKASDELLTDKKVIIFKICIPIDLILLANMAPEATEVCLCRDLSNSCWMPRIW